MGSITTGGNLFTEFISLFHTLTMLKTWYNLGKCQLPESQSLPPSTTGGYVFSLSTPGGGTPSQPR